MIYLFKDKSLLISVWWYVILIDDIKLVYRVLKNLGFRVCIDKLLY